MSREQRWRFGVLGAAVALIATSLAAPRSAFGANVLPFVAFFLIIIPAHELGHALAGALVGHRIVLIRLGVGLKLFAFTAFGTAVELRAFPLGGATFAFPHRPRRGVRLREWVFAAGGLAANLLLYIVLRRLYGAGLYDDDHHPFATMAASANLTIMILNAIPFRLPEGTMSDGYHLLTIPFWPRARVDRIHIVAETTAISEAVERDELARAHTLAEDLRRRYPTHPSAALTLGFVLSRERREAEARVLWREAITQTDELVTVLLLKNNIAWATAVLGDAESFDEADRYSDEALAAAPDAVLVKGTRGAVLARLGRGEEAIPLLLAGLSAPTSPSRQYTKCFLARALTLAGRLDEARSALEEARRLDATCVLIPWVEAGLDSQGLAPGAAEMSRDEAERPATPNATARAAALRLWRRDVRILSFVALLLLSRAPGIGTLYPSILVLFLSIVPDASGVLALGAACAWTTLIQVGGQWHPMSVTTPPPAWAGAATLSLAAGSIWLFQRHRRLRPRPATRAPLVLALIVGLPVLASTFVSWLSFLRDSSPLNAHENLESLVDIGTGMVALAALGIVSRRRWARVMAVLPLGVALVALVGGSDFYLDHHVLAGIAATGAPLTWREQPATILRSRTITAGGEQAILSPSGRAFALLDEPDEDERSTVIHVADFGSRTADVEGTAAAFLDDDRLLVVRPRDAASRDDDDESDADRPGAELVEVRPFDGSTRVWSKALPKMRPYGVTLAIDRSSGAILVSGHTTPRRGLALRTTAERDAPLEEIPGPQGIFESDEWPIASFLETNTTGEVVLRRAVRPDYRERPSPWRRRPQLRGDLWLLAPRGATLLAPSMGSMKCVGDPTAGAPLWCLPSAGEVMTPILMRVDIERGVLERVPGRLPFGNSTEALDATHVAMLSYELRVLDLETRRGVRLTSPELRTNAWREHLARGGLAVLTRQGDARGASKDSTLTVYSQPSP
jgi:tetratricopeptide (TPR) repeat protein